jgi:hypothetical protein
MNPRGHPATGPIQDKYWRWISARRRNAPPRSAGAAATAPRLGPSCQVSRYRPEASSWVAVWLVTRGERAIGPNEGEVDGEPSRDRAGLSRCRRVTGRVRRVGPPASASAATFDCDSQVIVVQHEDEPARRIGKLAEERRKGRLDERGPGRREGGQCRSPDPWLDGAQRADDVGPEPDGIVVAGVRCSSSSPTWTSGSSLRTGELLRQLTLDPSPDYQPQAAR